MKPLVLFQIKAEAQSLIIAEKENLEKQSNLSSNITASSEDDLDWGDIYDDYEDFDYCSRVW